ncbi:ABC transporter substrate-binding protein [Roseococcus sp. SDR]|uniref:ABC transporter substrate-binding protein n=1 Tax=Roseococcus sp. SDR TaxID=2835532 RepID=UPI001BCCD5B0|nr:ABC transporter substrate-binding protein [Roseococcus sp. SDR]MBS7790958.1 ABC transporter substrate-binding protein [Roseococcus sp. SDR]MBV1846272.1 ABC transporter substrate-binding protein [Roseococcus sp. SDR]
MIARRILLLSPLLPLAAPSAALAQSAAAEVVERFHAALIAVMRDAQRLGVRGRYDRLAPVMGQAFDLAAMTRISVGPPWTGFSQPEQAALTEAFTRWSIATYAARFDGFSGESFTTTGTQVQPNGDALVRTTLNRTGGQEPVLLSYLLRGNPPRIVDIYLTGTISELASRRAEFTTLIREGGAERVTRELQARTARLLGG